MTVGIVGVGAMGLAITERLIAAGISVAGFRRGDLSAFRAAGGEPMPDVAAVAARAEPLILLLPDDEALLEVAAAAASVWRRGQTILCLSTHPVAVKRKAADMARACGAALLDGEISGTPDMLRAGLATVMIAGSRAQVACVRPVLDAFSGGVTVLAAFGEPAALKLVTNFLVGVHTAAAAEALQVARRLGLDVATAISAIAPSAGGSRMLGVRGPMMAEGEFGPGDMDGFLMVFAMLRTALEQRHQRAGPMLEFTEGLYRQAIADGFGDLDIAAIHESIGLDLDALADRSGVRGRNPGLAVLSRDGEG